LKGLYVTGRLVAIPRANAGIGGYFGYASGRDATRILQFAVNTVIYALTQPGRFDDAAIDADGELAVR